MSILKFTLKFIGFLILLYIFIKAILFLILCYELNEFNSHIINDDFNKFATFYKDDNIEIYVSKRTKCSFFYPGPDRRFCYINVLNHDHYIVPGGNVKWVMTLYEDSKDIEEFKRSISKMTDFYRDGYFKFCVSYVF